MFHIEKLTAKKHVVNVNEFKEALSTHLTLSVQL